MRGSMSRRDELEKVGLSLRMRLKTFESWEWECEDRRAGGAGGPPTPTGLPLTLPLKLNPAFSNSSLRLILTSHRYSSLPLTPSPTIRRSAPAAESGQLAIHNF